MADPVGAEIERYAASFTTPFAGAAAAAAEWTQANSSSPQMMAGLAEARLLEGLVIATRASNVLEIGTFTAVGALSIAEALPTGGRLTCLEIDPEMAQVARRHLRASPDGERVEVIVGPALESLSELPGPFDLIWVDAHKAEYPRYWQAVLPKLSEHGVIAADNLFRDGKVLDPAADDESTAGMREFTRIVQADPRVHNVLLTVGDGVMLAWWAPGQHDGGAASSPSR